MKAAVFSRLASFNLAALCLTRPPSISRSDSFILVALHACGLLALAQLTRVPPLWLVPLFGIFTAAQFLPRAPQVISPALLAPWWFVYLALALRFVLLRVARGELPGYFEYALPEARVLLHFEFFSAAALCYTGLILLTGLFPSRGKALAAAAIIGAGALGAWAAGEYLGHRTLGATGSDPYAYAQMGVDLATRGAFVHRFELFPLFADSKLEWFPLLHVGYRLPFNAQGDAITVWPPGGAVAFALAFWVGGEGALYWVNPLFSLLSAGVSALLAWELTRRETRTRRAVVAAMVGALLLTAHEIVNWAGVTMVDTQALVFSTLALYAALRVYRAGAWRWAVCAGIAWGLAYQVRHTQLVILFGILPLFLFSPNLRATRARNLLILFVAAFLVALPDLWYHHVYLGSWLTPESEELALFSLDALLPTLWAIGQGALIGAEFGWLCVFVLCGIFFYARRARRENFALWLWLAAALVIHLPYPALRLRDLIPEFPIIAFYAAFGIVCGSGALWARQRVWAQLAAACLVFIALELNLARVWNTLPRSAQPPPARFGAMTQAQRAAFAEIARVTPPNALVGASLNSGALDLYAHRAAFRPADWSKQEFRTFLSVTQAKGRTVYLLQDNASLARVMDDLRGAYRLERVATLDVPLFGKEPVANPGALWKLEIGN